MQETLGALELIVTGLQETESVCVRIESPANMIQRQHLGVVGCLLAKDKADINMMRTISPEPP